MPSDSAVDVANELPPLDAEYHNIPEPVADKLITVGEAAEQNDWPEEPVGAAGLTLKELLVPFFVDSVTIKVNPLPATVGVTLTPVNTPAVNAPEVPVIPAVPP